MQIGNRNAQHSFAQIPNVNQARSQFNRSFGAKDTLFFDELTPIFCDEIIPGDTMRLNLRAFTRLATQVVPVMDNMYMDYFFFFVPNRLVWENWEKFCGAQDDPGDSTDYLIPVIQTGTTGTIFPVGSIYDHFGLPPYESNDEFPYPVNVSALPFRAYALIWNEWFRDQNLQDSIVIPKGDGPDPDSTYTVLKSAKKHDYFTSALPWPQKGPAVDIPLIGPGTVSITGTGDQIQIVSADPENIWSRGLRYDVGGAVGNALGLGGPTAGTGSPAVGQPVGFGESPGLTGILSDATAVAINAIRNAFMIQSIYELDARGGTRYTEILRAHYGVTSPDFRLQRPEFLGGGTSKISQHPVTQTSEGTDTPLATLAAFSTAFEDGRIGFSKSFTEHGYVIGLVRARADITYQQGVYRPWTKRTRFDFFWPKLQQLGEQAIDNREIDITAPEGVFGYQERYAEYRYRPSEIRGQFRSAYSETLDVWHLAEEFETPPSLNSTFIQSNTPIERVLAVDEGYPHLLFDVFFDLHHSRPMMTYGVPATLGRF